MPCIFRNSRYNFNT